MSIAHNCRSGAPRISVTLVTVDWIGSRFSAEISTKNSTNAICILTIEFSSHFVVYAAARDSGSLIGALYLFLHTFLFAAVSWESRGEDSAGSCKSHLYHHSPPRVSVTKVTVDWIGFRFSEEISAKNSTNAMICILKFEFSSLGFTS
jgi:hypothetical protein